jgi:hypothetical protein
MLGAIFHFLAANGCASGGEQLCDKVFNKIASPLFTTMQILIPAAVGISAIHKLMEHRESGGGVLVELITKGGGAVLVLQLVKAVAGIN